jgi:hypothetical protein
MIGHQMADQIEACIYQIELANIWLTGYGERLIYGPFVSLWINAAANENYRAFGESLQYGI